MDMNEERIQILKDKLLINKIFLWIILVSLVLSLLCMGIAFLTDFWIPFVIFLSIYGLFSFIATYRNTFLGNFFNKTYQNGEGCFIYVIYVIVYPLVGMISCFSPVGLITVLVKMSQVSQELAALEKEKNKK